MRKKVFGVLAAMAVPAFPSGALAMGVSVKWAAGSGCSGQSPEIALSAVPKGTAKLVFAMSDLDLPTYDHGGGAIDYAGKSRFAPGEIFGAFSSYRGPCPPVGTQHRYRWTVEAQDASGKPLAKASTVVPFKR